MSGCSHSDVLSRADYASLPRLTASQLSILLHGILLTTSLAIGSYKTYRNIGP